MEHARTLEELKEILIEQLDFIRASCKAYDAGITAEGKRISIALRILLYDGKGRTKSLLSQLGVKDKISFFSTDEEGKRDWDKILLYYNIHMHMTPTGGKYVPITSMDFPFFAGSVPFDEWWGGVMVKVNNLLFTRGDLIRAIADTDGGAHVDASLGGNYAEMAKNNIDFIFTRDYGHNPTPEQQKEVEEAAKNPNPKAGPSLVSLEQREVSGYSPNTVFRNIDGNLGLVYMRQIAFEILKTFENEAINIGLDWPKDKSLFSTSTDDSTLPVE